jgi:hypothetical protein
MVIQMRTMADQGMRFPQMVVWPQVSLMAVMEQANMKTEAVAVVLVGDGLGTGNDSSSGGDSGGDGDKGESDSDKLLSGSFSLSSSSPRRLFLAFFIGGGAVGEGVQTWDDKLVRR